MTGTTRSNVRHAVRVAAVATAVVAVVLAIAFGAFDLIVDHRLSAQVDARLTAALEQARESLGVLPPGATARPPQINDADDAPLFVWLVTPSGRQIASSPTAPSLPRDVVSRTDRAATATIGPSVLRLEAVPFRGGLLVAGLSVAEQSRIHGDLIAVELIGGPIALVGMFLGSLLIGVEASAPVEQARRRQLEFTADASHELRTPLTVIDAEIDLALARPRPVEAYQETLARVRDESGRLRRIVENLLWLGRLDATPSPPGEPVDLDVIAEACVERFSAPAAARGIAIDYERTGNGEAWVVAQAEWVDRLAGVLVDNACRYAPEDGHVRVSVETKGGRVVLAVEDDGPGIPEDERPRLFDRFHRATHEPGGTGLGLAIGDAVVRATGGHWQVGRSDFGGARMAVSWHRPHGRQSPADTPPTAPASLQPQDR